MSVESITYIVYDNENVNKVTPLSNLIDSIKYVFGTSTAREAKSLGSIQENIILEDEVGDVLSIIEDE